MARRELHRLLDLDELQGVPVLVCANKIDLPGHVGKDDLIRGEMEQNGANNELVLKNDYKS